MDMASVQYGSAIAGGLVGAVVGAFVSYHFPRAAARKQATINLIERYNTPDMLTARSNTWTLLERWKEGNTDCVTFFRSKGKTKDEDLVLCQGMTRVLAFYASVRYSLDHRLIDLKLAQTFVAPFLGYFLEFFKELNQELMKHEGDKVVPPVRQMIYGVTGLESLLEQPPRYPDPVLNKP